jgi:HSP20 family protein
MEGLFTARTISPVFAALRSLERIQKRRRTAMQDVMHALGEMKGLYQRIMGQPAPHAYAPFPPGSDPRSHAVREAEHLEKLCQQVTAAPTMPAWVPRADTFATEDAFVILVDIPGVAREDLKVFATAGECVVRGERKLPEDPARLRPLALEGPRGRFERRFPLPAGSHPEQLHARCRDGVLELRITTDRARTPVEMKIEIE